ncbi:MAG: hypothetical protein HC802_23205, partial [Caldilineaceae bacterium]|nr:hypothetical protein [Caldilineaceae bacterium]
TTCAPRFRDAGRIGDADYNRDDERPMTVQMIDLNSRPELAETVAQWHQNAFGYLNPRRTVSERLAKLQTHLGGEAIPTTFVALLDGEPVGCASLVAEDYVYPARTPTPWLAGVYVNRSAGNWG